MAAGITFALLALLAWGFGDFFIQKTTRVIGIWKTLFFIGITAGIGLFPFVRGELWQLVAHPKDFLLLMLAGVVVLFAALFDFEALKVGKLAIVEPILGIELPITIGLAVVLWGEVLSLTQSLLATLVFIGIVLAATIHHTHLLYHRRIFEKGVLWSGLGAIGMGLVNFLIGVSSQTTSPLLTIWFTHSLVAVLCFAYLAARGEARTLLPDLARHPTLIATEALVDNAAWVFYAVAVTTIPISIAMTISESYIALAAILGIFVNREKLKPHQVVGAALAIGAVIALSAITNTSR